MTSVRKIARSVVDCGLLFWMFHTESDDTFLAQTTTKMSFKFSRRLSVPLVLHSSFLEAKIRSQSKALVEPQSVVRVCLCVCWQFCFICSGSKQNMFLKLTPILLVVIVQSSAPNTELTGCVSELSLCLVLLCFVTYIKLFHWHFLPKRLTGNRLRN